MKIIAITACPAGIAHTYMAASKLEAIAKKHGHEIQVEKQGAKGFEDKLSTKTIEEADIVIFAVDTKVKEAERFEGKKVYQCTVSDPIKNAQEVLDKAIEFTNSNEEAQKPKGSIKNHILTGVSYMIPVVIAASMIMAISRIGAMLFDVQDIWDAMHEGSDIIGFFHTLDGLGGMVLGLMLPVFAGFVSYSIADKSGLASGLAGGLLAKEIGAGFLGALAAGFLAGYATKMFMKTFNFKGAMSGLTTILVPVCSVLFTLLMIQYVIGIPFIWINDGLISLLGNVSGQNAVFVAFIIGAMMGSDLGGPINKAALVTSMGLLESGIYAPNTAAMVAIVIPAMGYGVATLIAKKDFSETYRNAGSASLIMGLIGVSEGAIPFTLANPKFLVIVNMLGCGIGSAVAVGLGAVNITTLSGFYGWLLVQNWPVYVVGIVVGVAIVAAGAYVSRKAFISDEATTII